MKVTICMGSACFIKGSKKIADAFISLVDEYGLKDKVDLCGAFCMGRCKDGVNVDVARRCRRIFQKQNSFGNKKVNQTEKRYKGDTI